MRTTAPLITLLAALTFAPSTVRADKMEIAASIEEVVISGQVEVPLYTAPDGSLVPCVKATVGEETLILALNITGGIYLSDGTIARLGLEADEVKQGDAKVKVVNVDTINIGGMALNGVEAEVGAPRGSGADPYGVPAASPEVDGWIGLSFVPAGWAILPSEGVVRFSPPNEAAALVDSLGTRPVSYRVTPARKEKYEKKKRIYLPTGPIIPVEIGGVKVEAIPTFATWNSSVRGDVEMRPGPTAQISGLPHTWADVQLGGQSVSSWTLSDGGLTRINAPQMVNDYTDAFIGAGVLSFYDIAGDSGGNRIAFRYAVEEQERQSSVALAIELAQAGIDKTAKAKEEAPPPEGEAAPSADDPPGSPALYSRLGQLQQRAGDLPGALESYSTLLAFEDGDKDCSNHLTLGRAHLDSNDIDSALASFQAASDLYHLWWDLPLDEREALDEARAEMEPDEQKAAEPKKQAGACFVADDYLAVAHMMTGDLDAVDALYAERLDLSPGLAVAQGNAAFLRGQLSTAQAAFRQAIQMEAKPDALHRLGLAVYAQNTGDWAGASRAYARALEINPYDVMIAQMWVDAAARATSPADALGVAATFSEANPDSAAGHIARVRAAAAAGDERELKKAVSLAERYFKRDDVLFSARAEFNAQQALMMVEAGQLAEARPVAEQALLMEPSNTTAWLALGNYYVRTGDIDRGEALLRRAGQHAPMNAGYALLLNASIPRPAEAPMDLDETP